VRLDYGQLERLPCPEAQCPSSLGELDEVLIANARAGLTPVDMVERKLLRLLGGHSWQVVMLRGGCRLSPSLHERPGIVASRRNMLCE